MLADVLDGARERIVDELTRHEDTTKRPDPPESGRRERLNALVETLIAALRRGSFSDHDRTPSAATMPDPALERDERLLVRSYLMELVQQQHQDVSLVEAGVVSDWTSSAEIDSLKDENRQLRALLDGVDECATTFSPDGRIRYANRASMQEFLLVCRLRPDEVIGKSMSELGVSAQMGFARSWADRLAHARAADSFEVMVRGREKEARFEALYGPDGAISAVTVLGRDIHGRKQAQKQVQLLSRLSMLVGRLNYEEAAEGLAHVPIPELADWCAVNITERGKILQLFIAQRNPAKASLQKALMEAFSRGDRHPLWQNMQTGGFQLLSEVNDNLLRSIVPDEDAFRLISQVGIRSLMLIPLVSRGEISGIITLAYTDESGRLYGRDDSALMEEFALHAAQLLENARLLSELQAGEERFRVALGCARTAVYEQDRSLRYVWDYNPISKESLVGKTPEKVFPPEDAKLLSKLKQQVLDTGKGVYDEVDVTYPGRPRGHYRKAIEPLRNHAGRIVGLIGVATDISEQQQAQQELAEALGFRERMMGILGHDLRNPLNAVTVADAVLLRRTDLPAEARDKALRIQRAADRMKEMIETLLDFTRARFTGKVPVAPAPNDLGELARGVVDEQRAAWPDHEFVLELHGDLHGDWDPGRLSQVISNLVGNAITYGDRATPILVSLDGEDDDVTLMINNRGPPIPPDLLPVLFEPFRRGTAEDRSPQGLGLGLYIVQQIVLAHDGTIDVESTAAEGTTFTVRLPRGHVSPTPPLYESAAHHA